MAIVYRHIRLDKNEPFYIGIGKTQERANTKKHRNNMWNKIVKKTNYRIDILFDDLTWEEACEKEKEFINLYGRKDLGTGTLVNMTDGGEGLINKIFTEETRKKMSESQKGNKNSFGYTHSEETRKKISESSKGKKMSAESIEKSRQSNLGKKLSEETRKKISESIKGIIRSEETRKKMSEAQKMMSKETKEKIKLANLGKKHSEETKKKMSEARKGKTPWNKGIKLKK